MAGAFVLFFAVCLIVVALIFVVLRRQALRTLRLLRRAARPALRELSDPAAALPRWILVTGRVAPGPEGILASPAFGTSCVWYRTTVSSTDGDGATGHADLGAGGSAVTVTDGAGHVQVHIELALKVGSHAPIERTRAEQVSVRRGVSPQDGSGLATLARAGLLPASTYPRFGSRTVSLSEVTIAADIEVSVVTRPRRPRPGAVMLVRRGAVSAGSPADWIARLEDDVATAARAALVLPLVGVALLAVATVLIWAGAR